jgi:hypothetical protein
MILGQSAGKRPFGALLAQHLILLRRKRRAPFRIGTVNFLGGSCGLWRLAHAATSCSGFTPIGCAGTLEGIAHLGLQL